MEPSKLAVAQGRIQGFQSSAARHHEARKALAHRRAVRQAERAERRTRRLAQTAQRLRARVAELEAATSQPARHL
jgi:hypothetical protein